METKIVDLTHTLSSDIPSWDGGTCFSISTALDYSECTAPNLFRVQRMEGKAGSGTHMDAPAHCFPDGKTTDSFLLKDLTTDCVVIHVHDEADENYLVTPAVIETFEKEHGLIPPNAFVIFHTGWDKHWSAPEKYRNDLKFPSVHIDAANLLLERGIAGIGIDTLSPDALGEDFPVHRAILGAGKYIVENIANAKDLPATGAKIMIMPMKIKEATEAPVRLAALLP